VPAKHFYEVSESSCVSILRKVNIIMKTMQERNSEYFDAAGNQRKEIPSDDDFVPGRDDEPGVDDPEEPDPESDDSKVKVVQDYIKTKHHYNDLVTAANNASRYGGRGGRGDAIWS
jgi:hypothetical protein